MTEPLPRPSDSDVSAFFEPDQRGRVQRVWDHVRGPWSWHRAWGLVCAALAGVPGVRGYVLSTTPLKDHPMYDVHERAHYKGQPLVDHPAGCFWGSFAGAYEDCWHIPYDADCRLDHGERPIRLEPPGGQHVAS